VLEANKLLVRRLVEDVFNGARPESAYEILAPDFVNHNALAGTPIGPEGTVRANAQIRAAFPDWRETIESLVAEGDRVALFAIARGIHSGAEFLGRRPGYRGVEVRGMAIFRIDKGRIAEQWGVVDMLGMLRQLGGFSA
jgi:predicted ester cyclase